MAAIMVPGHVYDSFMAIRLRLCDKRKAFNFVMARTQKRLQNIARTTNNGSNLTCCAIDVIPVVHIGVIVTRAFNYVAVVKLMWPKEFS